MTVKFDDLNPLRSWNTEGIVTPENGLKSFRTFEKRALGQIAATGTSSQLKTVLHWDAEGKSMSAFAYVSLDIIFSVV